VEKLVATEIVGYVTQSITQEEWWVWGLGSLFCLVPIIWLVIGILIAIWVYRDAESRGMNGALWLIIVILTGIIGLIIYLLVRAGEKGPREEGVKRICPQCGRVVKEDVKFCPHCGKELQ
jgi:heme/copper-type cytochrome/quinol oxidase subunit 2